MSRIYEALQKAETERRVDDDNVQRTPAHATTSVEEPSLPIERPEERVERVERFDRVERPESIPAPVLPLSAFEPDWAYDRHSGIDFDWNEIALRPWSPAIGRLPALMERGAEVEQFRSLRSRIFELRDAGPLKSILISSGLPQEGKSFIAANLAVSLAKHKNSKVLLIDGDMRRYTLHQTLGCESLPGLADYLAGKATAMEVMQRAAEPEGGVAQPTLPVNLTFIPGGDGGDKAADLSGNPRFGELIRLAAPHFDWIIVDSSPVLPVSDAVNLARSCDGVLLVARSEVTRYPVAQKAQFELKASRILGFVLNAVHRGPQAADYYGYEAEKE